MAEGKKSFLLYSDMLPTVKKMVEKDRINKTNNAGELFLHLLEYVSDNDPEPVNDIVDLMFEPFKTQLKRDLVKWEEKSPQRTEKARLAGLASAEARKLKKELNSTNELNNQLNSTKSTVSVNVSVSDNVNVNESEELNKEDVLFSDLENPTPPPKVEKIDYEKLKLFFNAHCGSLSKIQVLSEKRKKSISTLMKKFSKEDFIKVIEKVKVSDFLQGTNNRNWKADFDWILNQTNFIKVLEGNFDNKTPNILQNGKSEQQFAGTTTKTRARFSIARAEQTLLADAERKRTEMENRNGQ